MGVSKAMKRRKRRAAKNGKARHRLRAGSVRHKQRQGLLIERKRKLAMEKPFRISL